jgi:uncharacterized protein (DUF433 family)
MVRQPFQIIGHGIYSFGEASRLTGIPAPRIRRWLHGYDFRSKSIPRHSPPLLRQDYLAVGEGSWISFADLIEVRFLEAFRREGVSWPTIRIAAQRASELLKQDHPFSSRKFKTDGKTIMTEIAEEGVQELLDLVRNQTAFKRIIDPYLYRGIEFGPSREAARWWHEAGHRKIVIDPQRSFGKPILAKEGLPTGVLFDAWKVAGSIEQVAWQFEVARTSVSVAVDFEQHLAA